MKPKKIVTMALLSVPLYFFTPNNAKAGDFNIKLKDSTVEIDKTDKDYIADESSLASNIDENTKLNKYIEEYEEDTKEGGNYFEDSDFNGYLSRVDKRFTKEVERRRFRFEISRDLEKFLRNPDEAVEGMDYVERKDYINKVDDELKKILRGEARRQLVKKELKNSTFYKNFKANLKRYKKKVKGSFKNKPQNYYEVNNASNTQHHIKSNTAEFIIEETHIEKLDNGKANLYLTSYKTDVVAGKNGNFKCKIDADLFSFHSFDYNPELDIKIITNEKVIHFNTDYELRGESLRARITSPLPQKCSLSIHYNRNTGTGADTVSTTISRHIKKWTVSLNYSAEPEDIDEGTYWLRFERRF